MKAISLWQPWATAIALGVKQIETRGWHTKHLGELAICAAQKRTPELRDIFNDLLNEHDSARFAFGDALELDFDTLPFGKVVAVVDLYAVGDVDFFDLNKISPVERAFGNYDAGRKLWWMRNVKRLREPVPVTGRQQMFNLPAEVEAEVRAQL